MFLFDGIPSGVREVVQHKLPLWTDVTNLLWMLHTTSRQKYENLRAASTVLRVSKPLQSRQDFRIAASSVESKLIWKPLAYVRCTFGGLRENSHLWIPWVAQLAGLKPVPTLGGDISRLLWHDYISTDWCDHGCWTGIIWAPLGAQRPGKLLPLRGGTSTVAWGVVAWPPHHHGQRQNDHATPKRLKHIMVTQNPNNCMWPQRGASPSLIVTRCLVHTQDWKWAFSSCWCIRITKALSLD